MQERCCCIWKIATYKPLSPYVAQLYYLYNAQKHVREKQWGKNRLRLVMNLSVGRINKPSHQIQQKVCLNSSFLDWEFWLLFYKLDSYAQIALGASDYLTFLIQNTARGSSKNNDMSIWPSQMSYRSFLGLEELIPHLLNSQKNVTHVNTAYQWYHDHTPANSLS